MAPPRLNIILPGSTNWTSYEETGAGKPYNWQKKIISAKSGSVAGEVQANGRVKYLLYTYRFESYAGEKLTSSREEDICIYLTFGADNTPTAVYDRYGQSTTLMSLSESLGSYVLTDTRTPNTVMAGQQQAGKKTITTRFTLEQAKAFRVVAPKGAAIQVAVEEGETATVAAGTEREFTFYGLSGSAVFTAQLLANHQFVRWLRNGSDKGTSPSKTLDVYEGDVFTCVTREVYNVTLIAPAGITITYKAGLDGTEQAAGSVSPGATKVVQLTRETTGNMTLVLEASPFDLRTFLGWTKDGTVVDRWSNPVTLIANEAATYSCNVGSSETPTTGSGRLLYGRYGGLLYADILQAATTHSIQLSATFANSGHTIDWVICRVGATETQKSQDIQTTFSTSQTVAFPAVGSNSGQLLFADESIPGANPPRLVKVRMNCQVSTHNYSVTLKVDGAVVYQESNLSGTFSKTLEVS